MRKLEKGAIQKKWRDVRSIALIYPNKYKVGMGNLAIHFLYDQLNSFNDILCERVFLPDNKNDLIRSLESNHPLTDFDAIFITVSFENDFENILTILKESGIELCSKKRKNGPLIIVGGPAVTINPNALKYVADGIFIGEVDDQIEDIVDILRDDQNDSVKALSKMDGMYVPSITNEIPKRHVVKDLDKYPVHTTIEATSAEFGEMFLIEIGRGCSFACKYCTVPAIYKPFRTRSFESLWEIAKMGLKKQKRLGLICPEVLDHPAFLKLAKKIIKEGGAFSTSSVRADQVTKENAELLAKGGMKSISLGVEAGTEKLRSKIGKRVKDEVFVESAKTLTNAGIKKIKLYFMIGLPGETEEDVSALIELSKLIQKSVKKGARVEVVLSPFVPKPGTGFSNEEFAGKKYLTEVHNRIRPKLSKLGIKVSGRTIKEAEKEYKNSTIVL